MSIIVWSLQWCSKIWYLFNETNILVVNWPEWHCKLQHLFCGALYKQWKIKKTCCSIPYLAFCFSHLMSIDHLQFGVSHQHLCGDPECQRGLKTLFRLVGSFPLRNNFMTNIFLHSHFLLQLSIVESYWLNGKGFSIPFDTQGHHKDVGDSQGSEFTQEKGWIQNWHHSGVKCEKNVH